MSTPSLGFHAVQKDNFIFTITTGDIQGLTLSADNVVKKTPAYAIWNTEESVCAKSSGVAN